MTTLTQQPVESWNPCSFQGHLDELQRRHEDVGEPILNHSLTGAALASQELEGYASAVGALLDHLAGKHADGCLVELVAREQLHQDMSAQLAKSVIAVELAKGRQAFSGGA